MPKPERAWEVSPHHPFEKHDDNLWSVRTQLPGGRQGERRMVIARMKDGRLVFYNAAPLEQAALDELSAWGKPAFLVLPSNLHMMDGHAFQQRLGLEVYGPARDAQMAARVKVAGALEAFPSDGTVELVSAAGTKNGEAVMLVHSGDGARTSIAFADIVMNVPKGSGGLFAKLAGFVTGEPAIPWSIRAFLVNDKPALRAQLTAWAALPSLARIVPSHGELVTVDAKGALQRIAASL